MTDIEKIKIGSTEYDVKDASAVHPSDLAEVATTGDYDDLTNKPTFKTINSTDITGSGDIDTKEIFVAEYGVTTFADITTAYSAGKTLFCKNYNSICQLIQFTSGASAEFSCTSFVQENHPISIRYFKCTSNDTWTNKFIIADNTLQSDSSHIYIDSVRDQNTGTIKTWTGTKTEYDAIATKDSSTLYFCTDTGQLFKGTTELTSNYATTTALDGKVSKSGDTMTGSLGIDADVKYPLEVSSNVTSTSTDEEWINIKDTSMNLTDTPSANRILGVRGSFNDNAIGDVRFAKLTDGSTTSRFVAFNSISGNVVNAQFGVNINASGNATLTIPAYAIHNQLGKYWLPSTTTQTLTRPASQGTVTAPDDGYIYFIHRVASAGQVIGLSSRVMAAQTAHSNNQLLRCWIPVEKGNSVTVEYTGTATTNPRSELVFRKSIGATH